MNPRTLPTLLILALATLLPACALGPRAPAEKDAEARLFRPVSDKAVIYLLREYGDIYTLEVKVGLDGKDVGSTWPGTYHRWEIEPGEHTITASAGVGAVPNTDWQIVGSGDYDGDGKSDVLWRNSVTGTNWMYLMNGGTITTSVGVSVTPDLNWAIVGNGDYDGDGKSDILWRNAVTGTNWLYLMNGTSIATSASISVLPDTSWKIVGDGDYNGDGKADVLWRNTATGANRMYLMDGTSIISNSAVSTVTDQNWQIVNPN